MRWFYGVFYLKFGVGQHGGGNRCSKITWEALHWIGLDWVAWMDLGMNGMGWDGKDGI